MIFSKAMTVDEHGALLKGWETRDTRQGTELCSKLRKAEKV
jgi:allantoicase